jgi:hypothetical protein
MTVDVDPSLPVISAGRLNILKAVACYDDQIEVDARGWLRGRFATLTKLMIDGQERSIATLARVLPFFNEGSGKPLRAFVKAANGEISVLDAMRPEGTISFEVLGADRPEDIPISRVRDIIPRTCRSGS